MCVCVHPSSDMKFTVQAHIQSRANNFKRKLSQAEKSIYYLSGEDILVACDRTMLGYESRQM